MEKLGKGIILFVLTIFMSMAWFGSAVAQTGIADCADLQSMQTDIDDVDISPERLMASECDAKCKYKKCDAKNEATFQECIRKARGHEENQKCADEWRERQWQCKPAIMVSFSRAQDWLPFKVKTL